MYDAGRSRRVSPYLAYNYPLLIECLTVEHWDMSAEAMTYCTNYMDIYGNSSRLNESPSRRPDRRYNHVFIFPPLQLLTPISNVSACESVVSELKPPFVSSPGIVRSAAKLDPAWKRTDADTGTSVLPSSRLSKSRRLSIKRFMRMSGCKGTPEFHARLSQKWVWTDHRDSKRRHRGRHLSSTG